MPASRSDSNILGTNPAFQARVQSSMLATAVSVSTEGFGGGGGLHAFRLQLVHQILATPTTLNNFATMFALSAATDATVLSDATQAGTVVLTAGNIAAQQALVTDAHMDSAVIGQFNAYAQGMPV